MNKVVYSFCVCVWLGELLIFKFTVTAPERTGNKKIKDSNK